MQLLSKALAFAISLFITNTWSSATSSEDVALSMVPRGKISSQEGRDFIIKTKSGSKINIEFERSGKLDEASGKNLNKGDDFEPGDGLLSLGTIASKVQKKDQKLTGKWQLEKDPTLGWVYELSESILVDAKTGKPINKQAQTNETDSQ